MMMSDKCFERVLFDICDKLAAGLGEEVANEERLEGYHKIVGAICDINSSIPSRFGYFIEMVDAGEDVYELEVLESGEDTTLHATMEEAEACAPKDGSAYLIHHSAPKEAFRVADLFGNVLGEGELYTSYNEAVIAILRECVPEWNQTVQHLKEISQPAIFTPEWEEELKKQVKVDEALSDGVTLSEEALEANYVYHLILSANQGVEYSVATTYPA